MYVDVNIHVICTCNGRFNGRYLYVYVHVHHINVIVYVVIVSYNVVSFRWLYANKCISSYFKRSKWNWSDIKEQG